MKKGDYDGATRLAVRRLAQNNKNEKMILVLEHAFEKAQEHDLARVSFLRKEGQPSSWEEINTIYKRIDHRQRLVKTVTPLTLKKENNRLAVFKFEDVDDALIGSQQQAAAYLYASAQKNIARAKQTNDRFAARNAFYDLKKIDAYYRDYKDKETLKAEAKNLGISHVFVKMMNNSGMIMPERFEQELLKVYVNDLDSEWLDFATKRRSDQIYDYHIVMNIGQVAVTPEQQHDREYTEERDIQDGSEPVLDGRGNPKKDSLGRPITKPRYRHVKAKILEVQQQKSARVAGTMEIYEVANHEPQRLKQVPITADAIFENYAATFKGDREALTEQSAKRIGNRPVPFPSTPDLLLQAADRLKPILKQAIADNRKILEGRQP
jgi:hypothetical protein